MSEPLEIRRIVARRAWHNLERTIVVIVAGVLMAGASLACAITQDLDRNSQIQAVFLAAIGAAVLQSGARGFGDARKLVSRAPVLRLSAEGVWMRIGSLDADASARFPWTAVESVSVAPVPETAGLPDPGPRVVLRFVADESAIEHDPLTTTDVAKAMALGLPPLAAVTSMVFGSETGRRLPEVVAWLRENQPDLPVSGARGSD